MKKIKITSVLKNDQDNIIMDIKKDGTKVENNITYFEDDTKVILDIESNILIRENKDSIITFLFNDNLCQIKLNNMEDIINIVIFDIEIKKEDNRYMVNYRLEDELGLIFIIEWSNIE